LPQYRRTTPHTTDFRGCPLSGGIWSESIPESISANRAVCPVPPVALRTIGHPIFIIPNSEKYSVSEQIVHVTDDTFEAEVLQSESPVLVDYWAEWCGPCRMIAPILDEIAADYADRLKVCKLNVDENQNTPPRYGIRGIPTLMLFRNGEVEATKVGALSKSQLTAFLDSSLG